MLVRIVCSSYMHVLKVRDSITWSSIYEHDVNEAENLHEFSSSSRLEGASAGGNVEIKILMYIIYVF